MLISGRNDSNEGIVFTQCEDNGQQAPFVGNAKIWKYTNVVNIYCLIASQCELLARRPQRQSRMLTQRMKVNLGKTFLCQTHVVGRGAKVSQCICGIQGHSLRVGV